MKNLTQKFCLIIAIIFLSGCSILNQQASLLHMVKSGLTPNKYKVKRSGENSFPDNGTGLVSLNITTGHPSSAHAGVNTIWRKTNSDGTFSERISFYANIFKAGRVEYMFEPGTYFLDGFSFSLGGKGFVREGAFLNILSMKQKGWDEVRGEPLWFSFVVEKGKEVRIPDIIISAKCKNSFGSCGGEDFSVSMKVNEVSKEVINSFKIGYKINQQ